MDRRLRKKRIKFFLSPCPSIFRVKESTGWQQVFSSPRLDWIIDRVALNAKVMGGSLGDNDKMVAVASGTEIILWAVCPDGNGNEIGKISFLWFKIKVRIPQLALVSIQLLVHKKHSSSLRRLCHCFFYCYENLLLLLNVIAPSHL